MTFRRKTAPLDTAAIAACFSDADQAREALAAYRWPDGAVCPHCGTQARATRLQPQRDAKTHARRGLWQCNSCRKQFSVTVGTIFEDSHLPLNKWLAAIHCLCANQRGLTVPELRQSLGITYRSASSIARRIRRAVKQKPLARRFRSRGARNPAIQNRHPGRQVETLSLAPLEFAEAVTALLEIRPEDRLEALDRTAERLKLHTE